MGVFAIHDVTLKFSNEREGMGISAIQRLEAYTLTHPEEILLVRARVGTTPEAENEEVMIFKGFSSSLTGPTASDGDIPVLPEDAVIEGIDRLCSPYNPDSPVYLEQGLSWQKFAERLQ